MRSICSNGFDINAASVICNNLYKDAKVSAFFVGLNCIFKSFWFDTISCTGSENSI